MYVKSLQLNNFRNYENEKILFSRETNIFYGNNAQGKTNLLEAVSLFSSGKSYRRVPDRFLIKNGCDFAKISIEFNSFGTDKSAEIIIFKGKNKFIKLNGIPLKRTSELLGAFNCVVFSPEELFLINGAPELRRSFLDLFLSIQKPLYYDALKRYYKTLKQKNNLLKSIDENNEETLNVWNEELAVNGAKIMLYRRKMTNVLSVAADKAYKKITGNKESFGIKYIPCIADEASDEKELIKKFLLAAEKKKKAEILYETSLVGIHRDDIEFYIDGQNAKNFASQGQQRTAVISLKLGQADIIKEQSGDYPVFLFDDIMSELDQERRSFISGKINGSQVIITDTDRYPGGKTEKYFLVENGHVHEEK